MAASACAEMPREPCVLAVSGLMREAVARAASWTGEALDARLLKIAQALSDRPDDGRRWEEWAGWACIAPRTLTRRFIAETGFTFTEWCQCVRLLRALELLADGRQGTAIALDLGYDNVSAFIALFRRVFGVTPGRYDGLMR